MTTERREKHVLVENVLPSAINYLKILTKKWIRFKYFLNRMGVEKVVGVGGGE